MLGEYNPDNSAHQLLLADIDLAYLKIGGTLQIYLWQFDKKKIFFYNEHPPEKSAWETFLSKSVALAVLVFDVQ